MSRTAPRNAASEDGDLVRLLAAEERLERLLVDARAEAARLLAEAATGAEVRERGLDAELGKEAAALDERLQAERTSRESEIRDAAETTARRYDAVTKARVEAVADFIVTRLLAVP